MSAQTEAGRFSGIPQPEGLGRWRVPTLCVYLRRAVDDSARLLQP
jgi:hypothetical protein